MKCNAEHQTARDRHCRGKKLLQQEHLCEMLLFHAQNIIDPKLLFPAFHQKAVCVKQKNTDKNADYHNAKC